MVGEIHLSGPCLFDGYFGNPAATASVLLDGWFATGDRGFLYDGLLFVTGRCKDVIIVSGRNYHAFDIESIIAQVDGAKAGRSVALPEYDAGVGSERVLILLETDGDAVTRQGLRRAVRQLLLDELGLGAVRVDFVPPRWLVKTSSGKMSREENAKRYAEWRNGEDRKGDRHER
ncbi:AMP-binding protein [bacterium]|nr:AMP-binding protein [bacterium]